MDVAKWVFVATVLSTAFCAGVNVYTWLVGYPVWGVAGERFGVVHREYMARLTPVITVPHVVMFFSSAAGCWWRVMPGWACWVVFGLDAGVVLVSLVVAGPVHDRFMRDGLDEAGLRRLVGVSALRSVMVLGSCGALGWWVGRMVR